MPISLAIPSDLPLPDPKLARLVSDPFLGELYGKSYEYFIGAHEGFKGESGKRFGKDIVHLGTLVCHHRIKRSALPKELNKNKAKSLPNKYSVQKHSDFLSRNLDKTFSEGDLGLIEDLLKLARIYFKARPAGEIPWYYYVGLAAWELLILVRLRGGRVPTKMDVKQRAITKRKKAEGGKYKVPQRWDRVLSDFDLADLPSAQSKRRSTRHST